MAKIPALPSPTLPLVNTETGQMNAPWYQFFNGLYQATGGASGQITPNSIAAQGAISGTNATFTGQIEFGQYVGAHLVQSGYIQIKDVNGSSRRLLVG